MKTLILLAAAATKTLIPPETPQEQRYKILAPYFSPSPGEMVQVAPNEIRDRRKMDPMNMRGYIQVNPPKGVCFTITRHPDYPDDVVCQPQTLSFQVKELGPNGTFKWTIRTGPDDFGNEFFWKTPHRIAQAIPATDLVKNTPKPYPIANCTAYVTNKNHRQVILELMNGEKWVIAFPPTDTLMKQPEPAPNLYVDSGPQKGGVKSEASEAANKEFKVIVEKGKPADSVTKFWAIPTRNSYSMSASNFKSSDTTTGMKGRCRYQFSGAQNDPDSGWIECHDTDYYDVIYTFISCAKPLITTRN